MDFPPLYLNLSDSCSDYRYLMNFDLYNAVISMLRSLIDGHLNEQWTKIIVVWPVSIPVGHGSLGSRYRETVTCCRRVFDLNNT